MNYRGLDRFHLGEGWVIQLGVALLEDVQKNDDFQVGNGQLIAQNEFRVYLLQTLRQGLKKSNENKESLQ